MKVIHVVPAISEEASGPSYSVPRLCESLRHHGVDVTLAALAWPDSARELPYLKTFPMDVGWPQRLGSSAALRRWLNAQVNTVEPIIFHNHGMWQMNALYPAWSARRSAGRCRLVASPRGALSDWAMQHGSPSKRIFWPLLQRRALAATDCWHATAEAEYLEIRRRGFQQPVAILPNGIDFIGSPGAASDASKSRTMLFLGRIHPKKGLDILLPAWTALEARFPDWRLVIVGDDIGYDGRAGHLAAMRELATALGAKRVEFAGARRGEDKWSAYRRAELFVLPTHSENFGLAVAEALACGTPAIVTHGAPWQGLEEVNAGWWVEASVAGLSQALQDALSQSSAALATMGAHGQQWVREEFDWNRIGERMAITYQWLAGSLDSRPSWIITD